MNPRRVVISVRSAPACRTPATNEKLVYLAILRASIPIRTSIPHVRELNQLVKEKKSIAPSVNYKLALLLSLLLLFPIIIFLSLLHLQC